MIAPALTSWPAKIFTPRRLLWESRPFFEEPRPFLCAISASSGDVAVRLASEKQARLGRRERRYRHVLARPRTTHGAALQPPDVRMTLPEEAPSSPPPRSRTRAPPARPFAWRGPARTRAPRRAPLRSSPPVAAASGATLASDALFSAAPCLAPRLAPPIDSISIWVSEARKPVWRLY